MSDVIADCWKNSGQEEALRSVSSISRLFETTSPSVYKSMFISEVFVDASLVTSRTRISIYIRKKNLSPRLQSRNDGSAKGVSQSETVGLLG